jgi:plasmid stabilization system protein ParE
MGVVLLVVGAVFLLQRPDPEVEGVERPPDLGRGHVDSPAYTSNTPTSGKHLADAPSCGVFTEPLESGLVVHALEHGTVVVWYRTDERDRLAQPLQTLAERWDSHVIVAPQPDLPSPIVATAWNRLKEYERADRRLADFIDTYRRRGPERVDCDL